MTLNLQYIADTHNGLPIAQLAPLESEEWQLLARDRQSVPVAGVSLWREFSNRLFAAITPPEPGTGVVVEFLKQEELYFYYDGRGLLQSVPLVDKPAEQDIRATYRFSRLLANATSLLDEYVSAVDGHEAGSILFNTGDDEEYGYPFLYADRNTGSVAFLRRVSVNGGCCDARGNALPDALVHATASQFGGLLIHPVASISRLFTILTNKIVDTVTPRPLVLLADQPIPPVSAHDPMDSEAWESRLDDLANSPRTQGSIEYLVDGAAFFPRLIDAIQSARESIDIRVYIFDNDDYALKIADLLKKRSDEVDVRVLVDGFGSITATSANSPSLPVNAASPPRIVHYLQENSNIRVRTALNTWMAGDHTKTIIIDKRIAFMGGMNLGREYRYDWHDLMVELRGPVVDEIQTAFDKAWILQSFLGDIRSTFHRPGDTVNPPSDRDVAIKLLFTRPGDSQILRTQLSAIAQARQRIYIENAYFTSDDIIFELAQARRRGVDVRVIIPYRSDAGFMDRSNVRSINAMLKNGIRVYIYPGESHIKGAVYDGWICLGSANFDQLSLRVNRELNISTTDAAAVQGFLDRVIYPDFEKSVELKEPLPEKWSDILMETLADQL